MSYVEDHAGALADITEAGAAVTFSFISPGTYDAEKDKFVTPTTTEVAGFAVRTRGNPDTYRALSLVESEAPTLLFAGSTFDEKPEPGYTVTWDSIEYTVQDVSVVSPDGNNIISKVLIAK